jgi:hypothetical protein
MTDKIRQHFGNKCTSGFSVYTNKNQIFAPDDGTITALEEIWHIKFLI